MKNPFRITSGKRGQSPKELRTQIAQLTAKVDEQEALLNETDDLIRSLIEDRAWFHDQWEIEGRRAIDAEIVVKCLTDQLATRGEELAAEKDKVTALEAIAGPYRDPAHESAPIFGEVTSEHPLPTFTADEDTLQIPVVKPLAEALGVAS